MVAIISFKTNTFSTLNEKIYIISNLCIIAAFYLHFNIAFQLMKMIENDQYYKNKVRILIINLLNHTMFNVYYFKKYCKKTYIFYKTALVYIHSTFPPLTHFFIFLLISLSNFAIFFFFVFIFFL